MTNAPPPDDVAAAPPQARQSPPTDQELVTTLFDLGRQVSAVLDLDELPQSLRRTSGC